ncbi:MAG: GNAT family N-acetyltransferase [Christensenellaceae bacterium]|nr:GNAT family N-acetyltransferase [Christensenellaceae bacterium]
MNFGKEAFIGAKKAKIGLLRQLGNNPPSPSTQAEKRALFGLCFYESLYTYSADSSYGSGAIMRVFRCLAKDAAYAVEAVHVIKQEEEKNTKLVSRPQMESFLSNPFNHFYVAVREDRVVGFLVAYELDRIDREQKMMFFYEVGVLSAFRRRGIGQKLIGRLKEYCMENHFMKMFLSTNRSNAPAMGLYRKTGGIESAEEDELFFTWRF